MEIFYQDDVWIQKSMKFGWYLPYTPKPREHGAWKVHYVDCVARINAKPMTKVWKLNNEEIYFKILKLLKIFFKGKRV